MKNKNLRSAEKILQDSYGVKGSKSRERFREEAYGYYLCEILKARRLELGYSQEYLAQLVGKKRPYISRVENGEDLRISNLVVIATALKLRLDLIAD